MYYRSMISKKIFSYCYIIIKKYVDSFLSKTCAKLVLLIHANDHNIGKTIFHIHYQKEFFIFYVNPNKI